METQDVISALTLLVAVRVFLPDACRLLRRVLGEGVRVGAAVLAERDRAPSNASAIDWGSAIHRERGRK